MVRPSCLTTNYQPVPSARSNFLPALSLPFRFGSDCCNGSGKLPFVVFASHDGVGRSAERTDPPEYRIAGFTGACARTSVSAVCHFDLFSFRTRLATHHAMLWTRARFLIAIFAVALLAVFSVVSAGRMAPDRESLARLSAAQVLGASAADFCETGSEDHAHRCPFCHKLPEPPHVSAPAVWRDVVHVIVILAGNDLVSGPQHIRPDVLSRAPPVTV